MHHIQDGKRLRILKRIFLAIAALIALMIMFVLLGDPDDVFNWLEATSQLRGNLDLTT
jgi:hypothetical protein